MRRFLCVGGPLHGQVKSLPKGNTLVAVEPARWSPDRDPELRQVVYYLRKIGNTKYSLCVLSLDGVGDINPWQLIDAMAIAYGPVIGATREP